MTLDATIGGVNSNSYVDLVYADAYFSTRLYSDAWLNAETFDKESALITATARLEEESYIGDRASSTQALSWPRYNVEKRDSLGSYTYYPIYYLITEIPKPVKDALCELAISLLVSDLSLTQLDIGSIKTLSVGPIVVTVGGGIGTMPSQVGKLLRWLRLGASGVPMIRA